MNLYEKLLHNNAKWSQKVHDDEPQFFKNLADIQKPDFLWIGCSDSRVPPDVITQTRPGQIFIHRNIANMVVHTDLNMLSVLQYAVEVLQVKHVIVCGHYGCGGVKAALSRNSFGLIDKWLRNIKDVYRFHQAEVDGQPTEAERVNRLIELNIKEQVENLAKTTIIQAAWKQHQRPHLHGWVYSLKDGLIHPLLDMGPESRLEHPIYEYDNL